MRLWLKIFLLCLVIPVCAEDKAPKGSPPAETKKIDPPIPVGQKVKGMHLPYYGPNGALRMQFDAEGATRVSTDNIQLEALRIETFDEKGKSDMVVTFPTAQFNLATQLITSQDTVSVKRTDFQITGKGMEFNTQTKSGRLFSDIRMEIFSRSSFSGKPDNGQ